MKCTLLIGSSSWL